MSRALNFSDNFDDHSGCCYRTAVLLQEMKLKMCVSITGWAMICAAATYYEHTVSVE